jgi:hypothetical protein
LTLKTLPSVQDMYVSYLLNLDSILKDLKTSLLFLVISAARVVTKNYLKYLEYISLTKKS